MKKILLNCLKIIYNLKVVQQAHGVYRMPAGAI